MNECENKHEIRCSNCTKATHTYMTKAGKQTKTTVSLAGSAPGYAGLNL